MSNQAQQGDVGVAIMGLLMLVGIGSCVFHHSDTGSTETKTVASPPANTVDRPYLAGDAGLQQAHDMDGSSDGFREIIAMKHSECWQSVTASRTARHEYQVICSAGGAGAGFAKFMVDTDTGDSQRTG